jgi:tRNA 5-methylaminomethyl-2-thiouridine biosynthesis bifunctional protein
VETRDPNLAWTADGAPRSGRFGDVYFSAGDGLTESRTVFLQGCGLPEAWRDRSHFCVAELGFGTGLNVAALLDLWRRQRPSGGRLHIFSVEAFPMRAEDAARALARWPELSEAADCLTRRWPARTPGFHRIDLEAFDAVLDVAVMDAAQALCEWRGRADAWFLDGFAPAANPEMWSDAVLERVAARSAPGARAATFTVAGAVRRGLVAAGFEVAKRPGFGRKRERLEAVLPGIPIGPARPRIAVVGAGVAGCAVVRALRAEGVTPLLIEAESPGSGASGNPAALVTPRFDAGGGASAAFFAQAFERAVAVYDVQPQAVIARGVLQLESGPRDASRFDRIVEQAFWPEGTLTRLDSSEAADRLGEPTERGGLFIRQGCVIAPAAVLSAWSGDVPIIRSRVDRLEAHGAAWRLVDGARATIAEVDAVILAPGWGLADLAPDLRLTPARGQASIAAGSQASAAAWGGYVVSTGEGVLFGATFDRGDIGCDERPLDDARNLATLAQARPVLAAEIAAMPITSRARVRVTTADHLPLCGRLAPGLWVLGGLGSRGFTTAPLLAEHLVAELLDRPSPLPRGLARLVEPRRGPATFQEAPRALS